MSRLINYLAITTDVKELISHPSAFSLSKLHLFKDVKLKSPVITDTGISKLLMSGKSKFRSVQNSSNSSLF